MSSQMVIVEPMEPTIQELNIQLAELQSQFEADKFYGEALADLEKSREALHFWAAPVEDLGLEQLHSLNSRLRELKTSVANQTRNLAMLQQIQRYASSSSGGGNEAYVLELGIVMTPQGYALR